MLAVYSNECELHAGGVELHRGQLLPCFENPQRQRMILRSLQQAGLGEIVEAVEFEKAVLFKVHDSGYLAFLETAHSRWLSADAEGDALPHTWPIRRMSSQVPENIYGQLGYYSFDAGTPITAGTWKAAIGAAQAALTAQNAVSDGHPSAFALTRPPGHHASRDYYGGYCFLNNAAIAAQGFLDSGASRVAILDVDYHHGNGTQDIFWDRDDVLVISIHADPSDAYPYFLGHRDERGVGRGQGYNVNFPLPTGTAWEDYRSTLQLAISRIHDEQVDFLVVSLGVDTFQHDPISAFRFRSEDFYSLGEFIAPLRKPTLFVMEGGYAVDQLGENVVGVLAGFDSATR